SRDIGNTMADVAFAKLTHDLRWQIFPQPLSQQTRDLTYRSRPPGADVERLIVGARLLERQEIGLNDIADVNEVPCLFAVFKDHWGLILKEPRRKDGTDTGVRI